MRWYRINALMLKYYYITINRLDRIFDMLYWPLIGLLIWGFTSYFIMDLTKESQVLNIFLGGAILWTFYQRASQDMGNYILEDFWSRNLYNLLSTPVEPQEIILSAVLFGLIRSVITFGLLALLGAVLYSFNIFGAGIFVVLLFSLALLLLGWVFGIFVTGLIFRYGVKIQVFAWSFAFLIQPFSAVFYPLSSTPLWLQKISLVFPTTHAFEGMRYAFATGKIAWNSLFFAFFLDAILLIVMYYFFLHCFKQARKVGIIAKME
ncbi:ABC transporter permease [Candidatus Woesearchaeota archaeon]|nr:ABC transporter permease [Candidatus Woesearchaeota archaeon]